MEIGKSSNLSQVEEEMNFTLSKIQSTEIKESIRIADSNILPQIKNSTEIKPIGSNIKKNLEPENERLTEIDEKANENLEETKEKEEESQKMILIQKNENEKQEDPQKNVNFQVPFRIEDPHHVKITEEQSLNVSPNKDNKEEEPNNENIKYEKPAAEEEKKNLSKQLKIMERNRKQINLEAQVLANRIALLKQEELRTLKKIKETKNKADEIYQLKKQNHERVLEREKKLQDAKEDAMNKLIDRKLKRDLNKDSRNNFRVTFQNQKQQEKVMIRNESQRNQFLKENFQNQIMQKNAAKVNFVKKQILLGNLKVEEHKANKILKCKQGYENKINDEQTKIKKAEYDIIEMEKMELELIKKLQQSQYIQKTVYEELEGALTLPLIDFENKYKANNNENNDKSKKKKKTKKKKKNDLLKNKLNTGFKF